MQVVQNMLRGFGNRGGPLVTGVAVLGGGFYVLNNYSLLNVEGGHAAVVFNRATGMRDNHLAPGLHFLVPFLEVPHVYETRARPRQVQSITASRDLQQVNVTLRVLYEPDQTKLTQIFKELGGDYAERVLPSIVNEVLKSVMARYKADELIQKRTRVSAEIASALEERAERFHIRLSDVSITDLKFGKEYTAAVEAKQVAQQEAERAKYLVERAKQEKKSTIIRAEGEAKAAELIGQSMKESPGFLKLRRIEAARNISETIARSSNRVYLNADSLLMNVGDVNETGDVKGRK